MSNKKILELILLTSGFTMENFTLIRDGSCVVGYDFQAYRNGKFDFHVTTDSFEDAVYITLDNIYSSENVEFNPIIK
jgi:hypothetical protein